jgi:hypothetical protein
MVENLLPRLAWCGVGGQLLHHVECVSKRGGGMAAFCGELPGVGWKEVESDAFHYEMMSIESECQCHMLMMLKKLDRLLENL